MIKGVRGGWLCAASRFWIAVLVASVPFSAPASPAVDQARRITFAPSDPVVQQPVTFQAENFPNPQIKWDFGDGLPIACQGTTITHSYAQSGTFLVKAKSWCGDDAVTTTVSVRIKSREVRESRALFKISFIQLRFQDGKSYQTVAKNAKLKALADIKLEGTGVLRGRWVVDGATFKQFSQTASSARPCVIASGDVPGLPTTEPGLHEVTLRFTSPDVRMVIPRIRYFVSSQEGEPAPEPVAESEKADLLVESIEIKPDELFNGDLIYPKVIIKNNGNKAVSSFIIDYYFDGNPLPSHIVQNLGANSLTTMELSFIRAQGVGSHSFECRVDPKNLVAEDDENNNQKTVQLFIKGACDLYVESLEAVPSEIIEGEKTELKALIRNTGDLEAMDISVHFLLDGQPWEQKQGLSLAQNGSMPITLPDLMISGTGDHRIACVIDPENKIAERNESNNEKTCPFKVIEKVVPDFIISGALYPRYPSLSDELDVYINIKNIGDSSPYSLSDAFPQGSNVWTLICDGTDVLAEFTCQQTMGISGERGEWIKLPAGRLTTGPHRIEFVVDPENKVSELDETNNSMSIDTHVGGKPDLVMESCNIKSKEWPFTYVTVEYTVKNQGSKDVRFPYENNKGANALILSVWRGGPEGYKNPQNMEELVALIHSSCIIDPGKTQSGSWSINLRSMYDTYFFKLVLDPSNVCDELDESNNVLLLEYRPLKLPPLSGQ